MRRALACHVLALMVTFAGSAWIAECRADNQVIVPFAYWDIECNWTTEGWLIPGGSWRELYPTNGMMHEQLLYVDSDQSGFVSAGDEIRAVGPGTGVWHVTWVTTSLALDPLAANQRHLDVASDKFYWRCGSSLWTQGETCGPRYPTEGDSFYVLQPDFNQIVTVLFWFSIGVHAISLRVGDGAALVGPSLPPFDPEHQLTHYVAGIRCGVWLSWDPTTDAERSTWGSLKGIYRR